MDFLKIGYITKTHGLKGELKVFPLTDSPERFKKIKSIFILNENGEYLKEELEYSKLSPKNIIIKLKSCNIIEDAEKLRSKYIFVKKIDGVKLNEWEFYSQDIVDCKVFFNERELGIVIDLINSGANDNILIKTKDNDEVFYPFVRHFFDKIDTENKMIYINQIEDFFD